MSTVTLKRIDLTGNQIQEIEDGAFAKLSLLEDLNLSENRLTRLPMLPAKLIYFNANKNHLKTSGVKANAFKVPRQNFTRATKSAFLAVHVPLQHHRPKNTHNHDIYTKHPQEMFRWI